MSQTGWEKWWWHDWLNDSQLQAASPSTRGIWINLLGQMWVNDTDRIELSTGQMARLVRCTESELETFLKENSSLCFCDINVTPNGDVTVVSRRRSKNKTSKRNNRLRQERHRRNAKITPIEAEAEAEADKKRQKETGKKLADGGPQNCPHQKIIDLYHEHTPCRRIRTWEGQRPALLKTLWREHPELEWWAGFFRYVAKSDFLCGRCPPKNGSPVFMADLEWLIRPNNFQKVNEGKYHHVRRAQPRTDIGAHIH